jgi:hypothetical protein
LKRRAKAIEAINFDLMPLEPTKRDMITDTLSLLSDNDRINFAAKLRSAVKEHKSEVEVGLMIDDIISPKVLTLKTIYGEYSQDVEFLGRLFKEYVEGKLDETDMPKKKERSDDDEYEEVTVPLDFDSAQDFVIELNAKIR